MLGVFQESRVTQLPYYGKLSMHHAKSCWATRCEESTVSVATCGTNHTDNWQFSSEARHCGASRLPTAEARILLRHKWIVMAGDSITRFLFAALLRLLADNGELHHGHTPMYKAGCWCMLAGVQSARGDHITFQTYTELQCRAWPCMYIGHSCVLAMQMTKGLCLVTRTLSMTCLGLLKHPSCGHHTQQTSQAICSNGKFRNCRCT